MEAQAAISLWVRSVNKLKMRYITNIGDGAFAHNAVTSMNNEEGPYQDIKVTKEECVNHVSKRLGTSLRKLKAEEVEVKTRKGGKSDKKSLLGGRNKLTDTDIDKLKSYYGTSIRRNVGKTVAELKKGHNGLFLSLLEYG